MVTPSRPRVAGGRRSSNGIAGRTPERAAPRRAGGAGGVGADAPGASRVVEEPHAEVVPERRAAPGVTFTVTRWPARESTTGTLRPGVGLLHEPQELPDAADPLAVELRDVSPAFIPALSAGPPGVDGLDRRRRPSRSLLSIRVLGRDRRADARAAADCRTRARPRVAALGVDARAPARSRPPAPRRRPALPNSIPSSDALRK